MAVWEFCTKPWEKSRNGWWLPIGLPTLGTSTYAIYRFAFLAMLETTNLTVLISPEIQTQLRHVYSCAAPTLVFLHCKTSISGWGGPDADAGMHQPVD